MVLGLVTSSVGQATTEASVTSMWDDPMISFYVVVGFLFVVVILVLMVALYMLQVLNYMVKQATKERSERLGIAYTRKNLLSGQPFGTSRMILFR
jgi:ABC-type protease/lipase transport system fused ATPase/permease subunit